MQTAFAENEVVRGFFTPRNLIVELRKLVLQLCTLILTDDKNLTNKNNNLKRLQ
jgi:hypothetical protein